MQLSTPALRRPPAASDAEIRAYLLPRLKAGKQPTYAAMRTDLGGGGFSRLVRIRNQVEAELRGARADEEPGDDRARAAALVTTLEALFDRQWKAIEEWERRSLNKLDASLPAAGPSAAKERGAREARSVQADRLEAVERRLLATVDKLQAPVSTLRDSATVEDVPPAWARQAAASATAALDGRLESMEESVREASAGARATFDLAAEVARGVAAEAALQLQDARSTFGKTIRDELANLDQSVLLDGMQQAVKNVQGQIKAGFSAAAGVADRRAVAIRDVILAMVDIEALQCDMLESGVDRRPTGKRWRHPTSRHPFSKRARK